MLPSGKVAGGAPFNIVNRANALGTKSIVISSVGNDMLGDELVDLVQQKGNSTDLIQRHPCLATSTVEIHLGDDGEPFYNIVAPVAWDDIPCNQSICEHVSNSKAFVYSSLGLRDERARKSLFDLIHVAALKVCDINLRDGHFEKETIFKMLEHADILRMNEHELNMISNWLELKSETEEDRLAEIGAKYNYSLVIATLGPKGALVYSAGQFIRQQVFKVKVADTVGSGDAFLAAFLVKYLKNKTLAECLRFACAVGALNASKPGGTPIISDSEIELMLSDPILL